MSEDRLSLTGRQPQAEQEEVLSLTGFSQELMSEEDAFEYANFASASLDESPEEYLARSRYVRRAPGERTGSTRRSRDGPPCPRGHAGRC